MDTLAGLAALELSGGNGGRDVDSDDESDDDEEDEGPRVMKLMVRSEKPK